MEFQHKHPTELDHELCHSQGDEFLPVFLLSPVPEQPPWAAWQGERGDANMKCNQANIEQNDSFLWSEVVCLQNMWFCKVLFLDKMGKGWS